MDTGTQAGAHAHTHTHTHVHAPAATLDSQVGVPERRCNIYIYNHIYIYIYTCLIISFEGGMCVSSVLSIFNLKTCNMLHHCSIHNTQHRHRRAHHYLDSAALANRSCCTLASVHPLWTQVPPAASHRSLGTLGPWTMEHNTAARTVTLPHCD